MMKRVCIITGAAGHLARTTIARLRELNMPMRGLIMPGEQGTDDDMIRYYRGDVTQPETLEPLFEGLDGAEVTVLHMAAIISIQRKISPRIYDVNVNGTKHVIAACERHGVHRLIYVSSVHALPIPDRTSTMREIDRFAPESVDGAYAVTKAEAAQAVLDASRRGLNALVLQPSGIVGPGDTGHNHINQLVSMYLRHRLPFGVRGGYDFVDVRDVVEGIVAAMDKGRAGQCYLLTNRFFSISELIEYMRMATGRACRKPCVPQWAARAAVPFIEGYACIAHKRPIFTRYSLYVLGSNGHFSHDKATNELDYHPRDMKLTIADTVAYMRKQLEHGA